MAVDSVLLAGTYGPPTARAPSTLLTKNPKMGLQSSERACPASPSLPQLIQQTAKRLLRSRPSLFTAADPAETTKFEQRRQVLELRMSNAESASQWEEAARELDQLEGNDRWKEDPATGDHNADLIESRLRELDAARANCDVREMLFLIRNTLSRDLGGMGTADLYRYSHTGTKRIIERYVESAVQTVEALVKRTEGSLPEGMRYQDVHDELVDTRQNFGRSALMLSGGATYGMTHIGVVKALFEAKLLPRIISGASAGSIICAVLCTRTDEEMPTVLKTFPYGDLAVFEEAGRDESVASHIRKLLTEGSWSDIKHLTRVMRDLLGDITFQEAYNRTRRICNITVSSASIFELPRLLNYYTAPDVMIWSAVVVSCSVPVLFQPSHLLVKDPETGKHIPWNPSPQRWIDGSVDNDLPTARLAEMFGVNHFIVSQVNPHVVPFLTRDDRPLTLEERSQASSYGGGGSINKSFYSACRSLLSTVTALAKDEALYRLNFAAELGIFPNLFTKLCSVMSQKYSGDITIIPDIDFQDLPRILKNPTTDFMLRSCLTGERAAWPQLRRIRDHCAIELAIDRAIHDLRARAAFSPSQVNLRRMMGNRVATGEVGQPVTQLHHRERRRSGGSLQLLMRQRLNRGEVEQIMTDNESRRGDGDGEEDSSPSDDADDDEDPPLELDARRGDRRRPRLPSVASSAAAPQQAGGGGYDSLLKPVLRRATRSHHTLPVTMRSRLSAASPSKYEPTVFPAPDTLYMSALSSDFVRVESPPAILSPSPSASTESSVMSPPSEPQAVGAAAASPQPGSRLGPQHLLLRSPWSSPPPLRNQPPARLEIASPTDETTLADSSVFDADVDSQSEAGNSVSDPDLDGGNSSSGLNSPAIAAARTNNTTLPRSPLGISVDKEQGDDEGVEGVTGGGSLEGGKNDGLWD